MRIVFFGTPDFAAASLLKLIEEGYEIVGVLTQPDRPKGRGMAVSYTPVKEIALKYELPLFQPESLNTPSVISILEDLRPDIFVVVAYGCKLSSKVLNIPIFGAINVHGSILPKYRGSAPIQWAVLNGDKTTGVSTMYLSDKMDAGDIIFTKETEIGEFETSGQLFERLMVLGAELLVGTLEAIRDGNAPRIKQREMDATYTKMLDKSMSPIDWNRSPREIVKWVYGLQPWPIATAEINGQILRVFSMDYSVSKTEKVPGSVVSVGKNEIIMACANGETVSIKEVQAAGKKRMSVSDYLRGHPFQVN